MLAIIPPAVPARKRFPGGFCLDLVLSVSLPANALGCGELSQLTRMSFKIFPTQTSLGFWDSPVWKGICWNLLFIRGRKAADTSQWHFVPKGWPRAQ